MFSDRELATKIAQFSMNAVMLTPDEKKELDAITSELLTLKNTKTEISKKYLVDNGKNPYFLGTQKIFKFAENSDTFKLLCQDSALPHTHSWAAILQQKKYPDFAIKRVGQGKPITVYDLYLSAFSLLKSETAESAAEKYYWLNKACDLGLFHAMVERTNRTIENLKKTTDPIGSLQPAAQQLIKDMQPICNIYAAAGYFHTALLLQELGNFYYDPDDDMKSVIGDQLYEAAAENFLCGKILYEGSQIKHDAKLFNVLTKNKGLSAFGFSTINAGQDMFLPLVDDPAKILTRAHQAIKEMQMPANKNVIPVSRP